MNSDVIARSTVGDVVVRAYRGGRKVLESLYSYDIDPERLSALVEMWRKSGARVVVEYPAAIQTELGFVELQRKHTQMARRRGRGG